MNNAVVITKAPALNYFHNYVQLPYDYGRPSYFMREDVKAIRETVYKSLDDLNEKTGWKKTFVGKKVLIKPNLVFVTPKTGYRYDYDIPQTTDPRVFEAVISYLKQLTDDIVIGEGSGLVTWSYAKMAGYDRIARHYNIPLVYFEEQSIDKYYVPKAEVGKEVFVPKTISEVIRGERLYVSCPKMKTNVYTGVTLGFKNAMGTLSCNMRYRNHTWQIDKKLTDLLYLFKPDLTVIDGIIGGEGNTPGPNDPVIVDKIITGTNSVEVDRVVTEMMGFDPKKNKLLIEATAKGFGDDQVEIYGDRTVTSFRPAEQTCYSARFKKNWPNVKLYVGHQNSRSPKIEDINAVTPDVVKAIEASCAGGCIASIATTMEVLFASYSYKKNHDQALTIIVGPGSIVNGVSYWFNEEGKAFTLEDLKKIDTMRIGIGECTSPAKEVCGDFVRGCGEVNNLAMRLTKAMKGTAGQFDPAYAPVLVAGLLRKYIVKSWRVIKDGESTEPAFDAFSDKIFPIPELPPEDMQKDWIYVPIPKLKGKEKIEALKTIRFLANFLF